MEVEGKQLLSCLLVTGSAGVLAGELILADVVQAMGVQRNAFSTNLEVMLGDDAASEDLAVSEVNS